MVCSVMNESEYLIIVDANMKVYNNYELDVR